MVGFWDWWNGNTTASTTTPEGLNTMATTDHITSSSAADTQVDNPDIALTFGVTAKDIVTGFVGIVMSRDLHLSGTEQWVLQPKCSEDKTNEVPHGFPFDTARLIVLDSGVSDFSEPLDDYTIELGQEVQDVVSGHKGIVTEIIEQFNGCVHCRVLSKALPGDKTSGTYITLDHKRFKFLGDGVSQKAPEPIKTSGTGCTIRDNGLRARF